MRRYYFREDSKEPREYLRQSPSSRGNREGRSGNVRDGVSTYNEVAPLAGVSQPLLSTWIKTSESYVATATPSSSLGPVCESARLSGKYSSLFLDKRPELPLGAPKRSFQNWRKGNEVESDWWESKPFQSFIHSSIHAVLKHDLQYLPASFRYLCI